MYVPTPGTVTEVFEQFGADSAVTGGVAAGLATAHNLTEAASNVVPLAAVSEPAELVSKLVLWGRPWPPVVVSGLAVVGGGPSVSA